MHSTLQSDAQKARLDKMDSPQRIKWLRDTYASYVLELAARHYFRLDGWTESVPKMEALACYTEAAAKYDLTSAETLAAFTADWKDGLDKSQNLGEKIKAISLGHLKLSRGRTDGLLQTLIADRHKWPDNLPFLTDQNLEAIAAGFKRRAA